MAELSPTPPLLDVQDLVKHFPVRSGLFSRQVQQVKAVDGVSFTLARGETLGLVGESGCGKTTVGRSILRLIEPTSGRVLLNGQELCGLSRAELRPLRQKMSIIFQDPYSSLNPRLTVETLVGEALEVHGLARGQERQDRVRALLQQVGLQGEQLDRYPHEFSGGQRQRIGIARALALDPQLIVCDEAVSALDVSIQAQVINLLQDLQRQRGLSYLFIAHDLGVVRHISQRIAVMYLGRIVELGAADALFADPRHPYTRALLDAIPHARPRRERRRRVLLQGDPPSPLNPPSGCAFHARCPLSDSQGGQRGRCATERPPLRPGPGGHAVACHAAEEGRLPPWDGGDL